MSRGIPRVGVLALQGGFDAHVRMLARLGVEASEVRHPHQLDPLDGLILPGGESTTLLKLMGHDPTWWQALPAFHRRGGAMFGTCAGVILLAREVHHPRQRSLALLDVEVDRNAYGRQLVSCEVTGSWSDGRALEMVFIRAPRITRLGAGLEILARHEGDPVLVREANVLAATFHPELTADPCVHQMFLAMAFWAMARNNAENDFGHDAVGDRQQEPTSLAMMASAAS
jgi:5'-phosphate synthase pdxT subunit